MGMDLELTLRISILADLPIAGSLLFLGTRILRAVSYPDFQRLAVVVGCRAAIAVILAVYVVISIR